MAKVFTKTINNIKVLVQRLSDPAWAIPSHGMDFSNGTYKLFTEYDLA